MTDLAIVLARMLHIADLEPGDDRSDLVNAGHYDMHAEDLLRTVQGEALSALVEAALAWRDEPDVDDDGMVSDATLDLCTAIDAYREATK